MADDWAAFTASPTATAPPAAKAPADDGWAAFTAPAPAAQKYDEYNAQGQWVGQSEEGFQGQNAKPQGGAGSAAPPEADKAAPGKSGYVANLGAGGNAAVASALGGPVDIATGGINLATRGINYATGAHIPEITDPVGGSGTFKRAMGVIGANPDDVKADGIGQEIARGVGGGIVSAAIPAAGVAGLVRGGVMAAPAAARTLAVLGDATPQNALLGAASGGAGEAAAAQVPDEYKPVAGMAGGLVGVGAPLAITAGLRGAARAAKDYIAPATGRTNPLLDTAGGVIADANGAPINMLSGDTLAATPNQVQIAGRRLQDTASDPAAVRTALDTQGPPALNDQPTTAQLTRDPGLLAAERGISRTSPNAQAPFLARAAAQNDTRVGGVRGVAEGGDPTALPEALQRQTADADAAAAARVAGVQAQTAGDVAATDAAGQAQVAGAQQAVEHAKTAREAESEAKLAALHETTGQTQARLEAESQARVDELRQTADQARAAVGGDLPAGSEGQVGAALRTPIDAANQAAKVQEGKLWEAVDPHGTLAVDMTPIKAGARSILKDMSPNAAPLAGNEAGIFETAAALPSTQSFRDLSALRGRITDAIRQERGPTGDPQAVRRMSILLGHVSDSMSGSVAEVSDGILKAERATVGALHSDGANESAIRGAGASDGGSLSGRDQGPGQANVIPDRAGKPNAVSGPSGLGGRNSGVAPGAANEVGALAGSNRKPESLVDFLISRGGVRDQTGDLAAMDAQTVHQKGAGRLVNPKGLSLDYAREAAAEAGFIRPNAEVNDLLDALGEHLSGNPRYRTSEQELGDQWGQTRRDAISADEARYDATDRVNSAAEDAGIGLTPKEREHAAELHMQGVHPDEAIQQAIAANEDSELQRNAERNSFGSPGIPLAQQTEMPVSGGSKLTPNFDAEAQARYAAARQATSERAATFKNPPGVKEALQGGQQSGTFRLSDVSVPAAFIRVGPEGATRVQSYLAAGGSPEALSDAAAFSLRRDASRADGTLDPAKVATWSQQRSSFLSALPGSAAKFGDAAAAQRVLDDATKAEAQALKASDSANVRILKDTSSNEARALKARSDEDLKALKATTSEAAQSLKDAVKAAQATVDEAVAARAEQSLAVQRSVVGKFLGTADPVTRVASILRSPTAVADMRELAARVANDPEAKAGLQRSVAEHILRDLKGNKGGVAGDEKFLKADQVQTFLRTREPALREIMTPGQIQSLRNVVESLERSDLSVSASKIAGGSDTVQNAHAAPKTLLGNFVHNAATNAGTGIGAVMGFVFGGGPAGGVLGAAAGKVGDIALQSARAANAAGMRTVDDLVANAMLHPQLAAVLLAKVTPNNRSSLSGALLSQLRRMSLVSTAVGQQDQGNARRNTLLQ